MTTDGEATTLLDLFSSSAVLTEQPENASYLGGLACLPLSDLLAAPTTLSTQSHTLTASLNALAHTSYPTILSLHNTSSALSKSLSSLDASLDTLLNTSLPALDDVARTFCEKSGPTVIEERQRTRVVLEQYDKLRDLLDVPVLMDTCVRNGLYAEALALAGHATAVLSALSTIRLHEGQSDGESGGGGGGELLSHHESSSGAGHAPTSPLPLVSALQVEIASSLRAMRLLLLGTLHEPGRKLPAFWKAIQFLRRMQVMPESELALAFVSARLDCLRNALQAVERDAGVSQVAALDDGGNGGKDGGSSADREREMDRRAEDVSRFLKKYIDVWREGAYDLVTQYATMFLFERTSSSSTSLPHVIPSASSSSYSPATTPLPDPVIKHTLPSTLLDLLLPTIGPYLRHAYPHLAPIATQLAYCSSAMARIGMDFRSLLSPLITRAVEDAFARDIKTGAEREWSATLAKHASVSASGSNNSRPTTLPSKWLLSSSSSSQPHTLPALSSISIAPSAPAHTPPQVLTAFPSLAMMLNAYLRALNRLRALAPMGAVGSVLDALESGLARNGEALLRYAREWQGDSGVDGADREKEVMRAAGAVYVRVLVPFLRRAIVEGVFGLAHEGDNEAEDNVAGGGAGSLKEVLRNWESWLSETS